MAFETGTATDYGDLLDRLVTFATANGWTAVQNNAALTVLKGEGLAATDEIFVGIKKYADALNDNYAWLLQGYTGYQNGLALDTQPGAIPAPAPALPLRNDTIPYWFFVNARRIVIVAKVGAVYESAYLGFILPYGTPGQWAYPICIGGSTLGPNPARFSTQGNNHSAPFIPLDQVLCLRDAAGVWQRLVLPQVNLIGSLKGRGTFPYCEGATSGYGWASIRPALDGSYMEHPIILLGDNPSNLYGEFDGVSHVAGAGMAAEDTVTIGADVWRVFQNIYRSGLLDFFAIKEA